jgi:hypothetical protein
MIIEIAGQQWQVHKVEAHHPGVMVDGTSRRGACWCGKAEIYISNEVAGDQVARVVMHELAHAYIYSTQAVQPEAWSEEEVCELIAIYAWEMSVLGLQICEELFPKTKLRSVNLVRHEARV